jgi:hypothetical protein
LKFITQRKQKIHPKKLGLKKIEFCWFIDHASPHLAKHCMQRLQLNLLRNETFAVRHNFAKYGENVDRAKSRKNQARLNAKGDNRRETCTKVARLTDFGRWS